MDKLIQFGTMQMLVEQLLDGFVTAKDILSSGDVGIGTGEGVDGELIIINGKAYKIDSSGNVIEINENFPIVYADVHRSDFKYWNHFENRSLQCLREDILRHVGTSNNFFSVKIEGDFKSVKTRSASKSDKPYPGLQDIAKKQKVFSQNNVNGTMIGYFTPVLYQGVGVPEFHQHFLSSELDFGGHVLDAWIDSANVSLQILDGIDISLPSNNQDYISANLNDLDQLNRAIHFAEQ